MKNYEDKLFWAVQQGEASLNVPNPATTGDISSSMISQMALFVPDHNIYVFPSARNTPTWILQKGTLACSSFARLKAKKSIFLYAQG